MIAHHRPTVAAFGGLSLLLLLSACSFKATFKETTDTTSNITGTTSGRIWWNGEVLPDRATLDERLAGAAAQTVQPELHLRPDKAAKYEVVAAVLASAQRLGLTRIGIIGSEQFIE